MSVLAPEQLQERLRLDFWVAMSMRSPQMNVTAYESLADLKARRCLVHGKLNGHLATHYLVDYYIKTLVGKDKFSAKTTVRFDLLDNSNYPFTSPTGWVFESELPWSPMFAKDLPISTHLEWERADGQLLLGHLFIRVAMLLNFDGFPTEPDYGGYNMEAAEYWRTRLGMQPITPNLLYPVLPLETSAPPLNAFISYLKGSIKRKKRQRRLQVFLCHSHGDKSAVRDLYRWLLNEGVDPWLDEEKLLPGQDWQYEITRAVRRADVVLVCLSRAAVNKRGFVHTEIKQALDISDQQPEGTIFVIPLRLEECDIPDRLHRWHWVNLFEEKGYERLSASLKLRSQTVLSDN